MAASVAGVVAPAHRVLASHYVIRPMWTWDGKVIPSLLATRSSVCRALVQLQECSE